MKENQPIFAQDQSRLHQFCKTVSPAGIFLGYALHAGGIWKGSMIEYHPIFAKDQSRLHQFG